MDFKYLYETELRNSCNFFKWGGERLRGRDDGGNVTVYNISLIGIVTVKPSLYHEYILIKIYSKK
jgi:hypothetical protein